MRFFRLDITLSLWQLLLTNFLWSSPLSRRLSLWPPICLSVSPLFLSVLADWIYLYECRGEHFLLPNFWATHRLDIEILPDCMSTGDTKRCTNKIEVLLSCGSTFIGPSTLTLKLDQWFPHKIHTGHPHTQHIHTNISQPPI